MKKLLPAFLFLFVASVVNAQSRVVIDKDAGSLFQQPGGFPFSEYGMFEGSTPTLYNSLDPAAIRLLYGKMNQFSPSDATAIRGFPYTQLKQYEANWIAANGAPIFVTATYQGKSRPVVFIWSLNLVNGIATAPPSAWQYAVNVADPRYVNFWINVYARGILGMSLYQTPNLWIHDDECAFDYSLFGVLDDNNKFIAGIPWDAPFPQNPQEYLTSVESFFSQVKQLAPDINLIPNVGSASDPAQFPELFANVTGAMHENIYSWAGNPSTYTRDSWYLQDFPLFTYLASKNKVGLFRALLPANDPNALINSFVMYSLMKGPSFFFAPGGATNATNVDPSTWQSIETLLGPPSGTYQSTQQPGQSVGHRLYWRNFQGGIVYLNFTGVPQTIMLPRAYFNPAKQSVTSLTIPDAQGTYVTSATAVTAMPTISPRRSVESSGPVTVTLTDSTPNATIYYTIDGTGPGKNSPVYTTPVNIPTSKTIQTRAFSPNANVSWEDSNGYPIITALPTLNFVSKGTTGLAGTYYPILQINAIPLQPITVTYQVSNNGTITTNTVSFLPNENYRYFPITAAGTSGYATVTIISAPGAILGTNKTFTVTLVPSYEALAKKLHMVEAIPAKKHR